MAQLTPQEQQEVSRFLEAGKPLPDKYRFLLFEDKREVELVWNGKTNEVTNAVLPFQVIEQVDEPRAEVDVKLQMSMFDVDQRGRQLKGWQNKLIWGDNKLILSSLKNGPLREEIERQGGIKLIYIDPPFDVGADFSMDIEIGDDTFTKRPNILEEIAYRDTWGKGTDSFLAMIYERLILMHELLAEDGTIYIHCDWRVNALLRLVLDEVFGQKGFVNEIVWKRRGGALNNYNSLGAVTDTIFCYRKSENAFFDPIKIKDSEEAKQYIRERFVYDDGDGRLYSRDPVTNPAAKPTPSLIYEYKGYQPPSKGLGLFSRNDEEMGRRRKTLLSFR
jgi:adenine-specific DNA-methyltransferase